MTPKTKKKFEMNSDKIIKLWMTIGWCAIVAMFVAIFCGGVKAMTDDAGTECVKIGESPLKQGNIEWECEIIVMPREPNYDGDYDFYGLNCLEDSVEIYKCR